jgi:hypothetical protein
MRRADLLSRPIETDPNPLADALRRAADGTDDELIRDWLVALAAGEEARDTRPRPTTPRTR